MVTIKNTDIKDVQDTLITVFMGKNFNLDDVTDYRLIFTKIVDGYNSDAKCFVRCNMFERDGNVRLVVTQDDFTSKGYSRRNVEHLIPLVKEVKNKIDGTLLDDIVNEVVNEIPNTRNTNKNTLGLKFSDEQIVLDVVNNSLSHGKIFVGDRILEIDGIVTDKMDKDSMTTYINNKWETVQSIIFTVEHEGQKSFIKISK